MATLSVVIPATDGRATLDRVVAAVERAASPPEELIVVDRPPYLGPAAARNRGARQARGDVLVFVDADVEVHEDAFARIRAAFDRNDGLVAVFGSYDDDPIDGGIVSDFRNLLHHHVHHQGAGRAATFWAGLGAIRRDAFLGAGGFDEHRFPRVSVEDIELGMRLAREGAPILLDPSIQGKHLKRWTLSGMLKTDLLRRGVPWLRLVLDHPSDATALNLGWPHRIGAAASVLLVAGLARGRFRAAGATLVFLVLLDRPFYALLFRRRGAKLAAAGIPLHVAHRLTAVASVPLALTSHFSHRLRRRYPAAPRAVPRYPPAPRRSG